MILLGAVHRAQDAVGDVRGSGDEEVVSARHRDLGERTWEARPDECTFRRCPCPLNCRRRGRVSRGRGDLMRTPMLALPLVVALLLGCEPATGTRAQENWEARLSGTSTLLFMRFSCQGETLSGTAEFAELTGTTPERFALSGTRSADTVSIVLSNPVSIPVRLSGWYVRDGAGLSGLLDGGAFNQLPVEFRR